jgi:hypothetical protein
MNCIRIMNQKKEKVFKDIIVLGFYKRFNVFHIIRNLLLLCNLVKNENLKFQSSIFPIRWANWFLIDTWILTQIFSFSNFSWRNWFNVHFGILHFLEIFCTTWIIKYESSFFFLFNLVMYITSLVETIHEGKDVLAKSGR